MKFFDRQEIIYAGDFEKEGAYIQYEFKSPSGWYAIYPIYNPKHSVTLEDFGIFLNHGGDSSLRFSFDGTVPYSEHEYPKKGDPLALITYFNEEEKETLEYFKRNKDASDNIDAAYNQGAKNDKDTNREEEGE